jgi:hypothetical protein
LKRGLADPTIVVVRESDRGHSPELDEVRRMLFPALSPDEGWARIDRAIRGAADDEHWAAIEETARQEDLSGDLISQLRQLRGKDRDYAPPADLQGADLDAYGGGYRAATEAPWDSADAAFRASSMRGEFGASFVRGWDDGKAKVTPPDDPAA